MVVSIFVFGAAIVRTGAAEFLGTRLFRLCARHELLLQAAVLAVTTVAVHSERPFTEYRGICGRRLPEMFGNLLPALECANV